MSRYFFDKYDMDFPEAPKVTPAASNPALAVANMAKRARGSMGWGPYVVFAEGLLKGSFYTDDGQVSWADLWGSDVNPEDREVLLRRAYRFYEEQHGRVDLGKDA